VTQLTSRQIRVARKIGAVVDELSLRSEAARRAIEAVREQRRRVRDDIARIDRRVRDEQLEADARHDATSKATLNSLREKHAALQEQLADCERQVEDTMAKLKRLTEFLAPWEATLDAVLAYMRASRASLGIAFGDDVPRSFQPDVVLSERPS